MSYSRERTLWEPTVGQLIEELSKYPDNWHFCIDTDGKTRFASTYPANQIDGSYHMFIAESAYTDTVFIELSHR